MAKLNSEQKIFILQRIAIFDSPLEIAEKFKEQFGLDLARQQIESYDPTKFAGRHLGKEWRAIFYATRKNFQENIMDVPIANKAVRIRRLEKLYHKHAGKRGNPKLAQEVLEQAAKETGGAYTNRREVSGPQGAPIQTETKQTVDVSKLSDAALKEIADLSS